MPFRITPYICRNALYITVNSHYIRHRVWSDTCSPISNTRHTDLLQARGLIPFLSALKGGVLNPSTRIKNEQRTGRRKNYSNFYLLFLSPIHIFGLFCHIFLIFRFGRQALRAYLHIAIVPANGRMGRGVPPITSRP
jgi:hypothetical protein